LAHGGAYHDFEDLVLAERWPQRRNVIVSDLVGLRCGLMDERAERLAQPDILERRAALGA